MNYDVPKEIYLNVSADFTTTSKYLKGVDGFSSQINVTNGSSFTATVYMQVSNDGEKWATLTADSISMSGTTATAVFDVPFTALSYYRLSIDILTGSADFEIIFNIKDV